MSSNNENKYDEIINLSKNRGILEPTSEVYEGFAGFFDYGPVGVELKKNIEKAWWRFFVQMRDDVVGMDGAIILHPTVWKASGHVDRFKDQIVACTKTPSHKFRADHVIEEELGIATEGMSNDELQKLITENKIKCPVCGSLLGEVSDFRTMFETSVGAESSLIAYLRPETAQAIFADFRWVKRTSRKSLPFGIAQIGKAFRNEISPRNFVFRSREFNQMELEYFIHPDQKFECKYLGDKELGKSARFLDMRTQLKNMEQKEKKTGDEGISMTFGEALEKKVVAWREFDASRKILSEQSSPWHAYWLCKTLEFYTSIGINENNLRFREHVPDELSHYSKATWDLEYRFPFGWKEIVGIANRSDYDLKQHSKFSNKDMSVYDEAKKQNVMPVVIEPSFGLERAIMAVLIESYDRREGAGKDAGKSAGDEKVVLHLANSIAPVKVIVLPLEKKPEPVKIAHDLFEKLKGMYMCDFDESGSIGKRYARADEIGVPVAITIDNESLTDHAATIRYRDTTKQERVPISDIPDKISQIINSSL